MAHSLDDYADKTEKPFRKPRWGDRLSLRARLLLLVVASIVPLVGMGTIAEYLDYRASKVRMYEGLLATARGTAFAVELELQLRVSALETLALSPALQTGDVESFDRQANAFLAHQQAGSVLSIASPDSRDTRFYVLQPQSIVPSQRNAMTAANRQVFATSRPVVTDIETNQIAGRPGFSVEVPVFRDGAVAYALSLWVSSDSLTGMLVGRRLPAGAVLAVVDTAGLIAARAPGAGRFDGSPIVPALWNEVRNNTEGVSAAPTLEGVPAVVAYARTASFGWTAIVGMPAESVSGPLRAGILLVAGAGATVLIAALLLASYLARAITGPIRQLGHIAARDGMTGLDDPPLTGLPETDRVARALTEAAAARHNAAAALAESEARFRALFERSPSGLILIDPETTCVIASNAVAASYVGHSAEAFRGRPIVDFALDTSPERIRAICRSVAAGETISYETRIQGLSGVRNLLVAAAPVQVGGRTLVLINQIDATALRRAEAGLRINEERLELARNGANLGIWDWDVVHGSLTWSEHQWYLHGLEPDTAGPSPTLWRNSINPADLPGVEKALAATLASGGQLFACEYSVVLPDGSQRRLLGRGQAIRDASGSPIRMVGINMDVTARYEAELARDRLIGTLESERSRLTGIIEALPIGVGIVDTNGRVILGNARMNRLIGQVLPSMSDTPSGEWIASDADGKPLAPADFPIRRALQYGETALPGVEFLRRDGNGQEIWLRVGGLPLRWEGEKVCEALGILLDIDAEKRLFGVQQEINARLEQRVLEEMTAREAAQQRAVLAERMQALGQIAGGIAHDFNNVLQAVSGGAALIERRPDQIERVLRSTRMILDAAQRGAAITSRLLTFARRGDLRAENVDAAALLADIAEVLSHTLGGSVVCSVNVPPGLPPLFADRGQLETVLVNLATNARDAMPHGGTLTFGAETECVAAGSSHAAGLLPGRYVRLVAADTGSGMDRAVLSRVTEPFFSTKEPGKGTGLGLAMAKGFAEQSGGGLSIESEVGQGTRIMLWLPASGSTGGAASPHAAPAQTGPYRPRVLLVDDDTMVREVLALSLEDGGYWVLQADCGAAALKHLASGEAVDILVSDLTMPAMDGVAVIRTAQEQRSGLPAVLLTGYPGDVAELAASGTFSLLRKPVTGLQLAERIGALLQQRRAVAVRDASGGVAEQRS